MSSDWEDVGRWAKIVLVVIVGLVLLFCVYITHQLNATGEIVDGTVIEVLDEVRGGSTVYTAIVKLSTSKEVAIPMDSVEYATVAVGDTVTTSRVDWIMSSVYSLTKKE